MPLWNYLVIAVFLALLAWPTAERYMRPIWRRLRRRSRRRRRKPNL